MKHLPYGETKVYYDGSHYIAIPKTERLFVRRKRTPEEEKITVTNKEKSKYGVEKNKKDAGEGERKIISGKGETWSESEEQIGEIRMSKKEIFEELYTQYSLLGYKEKRDKISEEMIQYFGEENSAKEYVKTQLERKKRNMLCRRTRMLRKANLADFNYFCTFTYDSGKHTEESFRKKLKICLRNLCYRKGWKYIGVWERSPKTKRLHFHGMFYIPKGEISGGIIKRRDYSLITHKMQTTYQNTFFNNKFGRSDFEQINSEKDLGSAINYILKYIEKTGEKIVYSKGLYQYFISDIMDEDIVCPIGIEDKKLLLYDDFKCWDEGTFMGRVSKETISKMRKCN